MRTEEQRVTNARTLVNQADQVIEVMEAIKRRVVLADGDNQGANRQANRLGTAITGSRSDGPQYADPTADEGWRRTNAMERGSIGLADVRELSYAVAELFEEWAEDRPADGGIRRCSEDDCAKPHEALGLCAKHYRKVRRAEEKRRAEQRARQEANQEGEP